MTIVSTKRARQRAKKAAAEGGSHQQALDRIAREEGHPHWGGKLKALAPPSPSAPPHRRVDFLDRTWLSQWPHDSGAVVDFVATALGRTDARDRDYTAALGVLMAHLRLLVDDDLITGQPTLHAAISSMAAKASNDRQRAWEEASKTGAVYDRPWQDVFVDMLATDGISDEWSQHIAVLRRATPVQISVALQSVTDNARDLSNDPLWTMRRVSVERFSDELIVEAVKVHFGDVWPTANEILCVREILSADGRVDLALHAAEMSIGKGVRKAAFIIDLDGLTRERRMAIAQTLLDQAGTYVSTLLTRYGPVVRRMVDLDPKSTMAAWLLDAFTKVDRGRMPFSFNLPARRDERATLDASLTLIAIQVEGEDWGRTTIEAAAFLIDDLLSVITSGGDRLSELVRNGLTPSYPAVMTLLDVELSNPGQIRLFATLNGMDEAMVSRLGTWLDNHDLMVLTARALEPFRNEAMFQAAS